MLRARIQFVLLLPTLGAAAILPMLFFSTPEAVAEGSWRAAIFNATALPGFLALVASVGLPAGSQLHRAVRWIVIVGLILAVVACVAFGLIMAIGPEGTFLPLHAPAQYLAIAGPLIVAVWNLWRLAGRVPRASAP